MRIEILVYTLIWVISYLVINKDYSKMVRSLSNYERKMMGIKAREHIQKRFDKHKVVSETIEALFYEEGSRKER